VTKRIKFNRLRNLKAEKLGKMINKNKRIKRLTNKLKKMKSLNRLADSTRVKKCKSKKIPKFNKIKLNKNRNKKRGVNLSNIILLMVVTI
jgi:hypothetical protein